MSDKPYLIKLAAILLLKAFFLGWFIKSNLIGLGPDEAQYWTWSQDLSLGYYSKPPGIAWQIWAGTHLFGNTEFGVRFGSIVLGTLLSLATFGLARACGLKPSTSFRAGVIIAFSPLGVLATFLAITDGGMVLFWTLSCIVWGDALRKGTPPNYWLLGILILGGALFKWTLYYFWIVVAVSLFFYPFLASWQLLGGIAVSLLGLIPSIVWNSQHQWVTFRHVFSTFHGNSSASPHSQGNFWAFIGEQIVLLSPLLFLLLIIGLIHSMRKKLNIPRAVKACGYLFAISLGIFCLFSIFKKIQGNWCDFIYPAGIVFLAWYACEATSWGRRWLQVGVLVSLLLCGAAFLIPFIQTKGWGAGFIEIPYKYNPFRHNVGWNNLREILQKKGYDPSNSFLFGDKYQTSSILSFYGPGQKHAYFLNLHGIRHNQFSFWPGMELEQVGNNGYFVMTENIPSLSAEVRLHYEKLLQEYFKEVQLIAIEPLFFSYGKPVKVAMIFWCKEYNGKSPPETKLY